MAAEKCAELLRIESDGFRYELNNRPEKIKTIYRFGHWLWIYFIVFSFTIGGLVGNVTKAKEYVYLHAPKYIKYIVDPTTEACKQAWREDEQIIKKLRRGLHD